MRVRWKGIKNIVSLKSNNIDAAPHVLDKNSSEIRDPVEIADQFNRLFTSVADKVTETI